MKFCPYCGKKYPPDIYASDISECVIDGNPLVDDALPPPVPEMPAPPPPVAAADKNLIFPEYRWKARAAWKCIAVIFTLEIVVVVLRMALNAHIHGFRNWGRTGTGYLFWSLVYYLISVIVAACFARTETWANFLKGFGLDRRTTEYVWYGILAALAIRLFGHIALISGLGKGVSNFDIAAFNQTAGPERYLFLVPLVLLAPVFEELINRGFLYKAFRGSYSTSLSTVTIIAWTAYNHWSQYSHSWVAAFDLSLLTVVQCRLREKSNSLWDCIVCHMAFNGTLLLLNGPHR